MLILLTVVLHPGQYVLNSPRAPFSIHAWVDGESVSSLTSTFALPFESTITAPGLALTAWFTHAAVADGLASPLHVFSLTPAFPSAVRRPLVTAWKNSTLSVIGMYQTVFPDSDLTFPSCGPGGGKLVVGLASAATF